ncbi:MAG TPA: RES family NAD+ phosphorylase, partial [Gemmatimonadaceae bacterium]|nr:RES family NAD+ phosphorylase [Gemmatimonadaceae bacterium]
RRLTTHGGRRGDGSARAMTRPWRPPELARLGGVASRVTLHADDTEPLQETETVWQPSHRIIGSEYAGENLFSRIAGDEELEALRELADLTSGAGGRHAGDIFLLPPGERIYGPGTALIMAAFAWPSRDTRFSRARGAYYAAREERTAIAETVYHRERFLRAAGSGPVVMEMTLLHADLRATLVDIRRGRPSPPGVYHDSDYTAGQELGELVRHLRGDGIRYDSVRASGGECAAIFRPRVLARCRPVRTLEYHWDGARIAEVRAGAG